MQEMRRSVGSEGEGRSIRSRLYSRTGMLCCIVALSMLPALPRDEQSLEENDGDRSGYVDARDSDTGALGAGATGDT